MNLKLPWAEDIRERTFAFWGEIGSWPTYHGASPADAVWARGGYVREALGAELDYVVFGNGRQEGKTAAERKAQALVAKGAKLTVLDGAGFIHLMRPQLDGVHFHFAGELDFGHGAAVASPAVLVATLGAVLADKVDANLDFLVVGNRRGKGKAAALAAAEQLRAQGSPLRVIDEAAFMELLSARSGAAATVATPAGVSPLAELIVALPAVTDAGRIKRALDMLRKESMQLYADVDATHVAGIVRSQTGHSDFYSTRLSSDGRFSCCDSSLTWCMGMNGGVCKHLLVLCLGLVQSHQLPAASARAWLANAKSAKPRTSPGGENMQQLLADTILHYRAAEAGEVDWRPTETVPEDYYAF